MRRALGAAHHDREGGEPGDAFLQETVTAVGEAFNNIAIHGYAAGQPDLVELQIEALDDALVVRIIDHGRSFDPALVPSPRLDALPESGMGLFIIHSFMDDVSYHPGTPNVLAMTKHRRRDHQLGKANDLPLASEPAALHFSNDSEESEIDTGSEGQASAAASEKLRAVDGTRSSGSRSASGRSGVRMRSALFFSKTGSSRQK